jgi:hypothetical protein
MVNAIDGSIYTFKKIETAYDSVKDVGTDFNEIAEKIEDFMAGHGYKPKLVGQKWKFKYVDI